MPFFKGEKESQPSLMERSLVMRETPFLLELGRLHTETVLISFLCHLSRPDTDQQNCRIGNKIVEECNLLKFKKIRRQILRSIEQKCRE